MAEHRSDTLVDALAAEAYRVRAQLDVASVSISVWERDRGLLRTLVNTGAISPGERERPTDEVYPVHTFPALVSLLEGKTPYCFGLGDRVDVSSASLAALLGKETQAAAPISVRGDVWGSLWVATLPGDRPLSRADLPRIVRAAHEIARLVTGLPAAG